MPRAFHVESLASFVTCQRVSRVYSPGTILFREGDAPEGVHILDSGRAKLYGATSRGKTFITKIAYSGELIGLNAVILGKPHLVSAEVLEPSRVSFVQRDDFLSFIRKNPEASAHVITQLSTNYYDAQRELRTLNLASNARERIARLLVSWIEESDGGSEDQAWVNMDVTQEDIAQMVGSSRETVSRVLSTLAQKGVLKVEGRVLTIPSISRLRTLARL